MSKLPGKRTVTPTREQLEAAEPTRSVWVMANAGSGKTHVLVNRVVRLLLAGCTPESILCLTFTKAAAAEMSLRLFKLLASWIGLSDAQLAAALTELGLEQVSPVELARARRLFAVAIETPGGLKIQTIHAFCEKLLQLFPAESGLAPGFRVMDETDRQLLLAEARNAALADAADADDLALLDEGLLAAESLEALCKSFLQATSPLNASIAEDVDPGAIDVALRSIIRTQSHGGTAEIETLILGRDRARYAHAAVSLTGVAPYRDRDAAAFFHTVHTCADAQMMITILTGTLFTKQGEPRKQGLFSTATRARLADICAWFDTECEELVTLLTLHTLSRKVDATAAVLRLMRRIDGKFRALKQQRGLYDFDDLIMRTRALVHNSPSAQWVLKKLDGNLAHILVDEAQDTSPAQWHIITALADEFFAGHGQTSGVRTLFVVGDIKQSIYSFQGADTVAFAGARDHFRSKTAGSGSPLREINLTVSYRTLPAVLKVVDTVFAADAPATKGLRQDGRDGGHSANRMEEGNGIFELWPLFQPPDAPPHAPWQAPVDRAGAESPRQQLARYIAARIKDWLGKRLLVSQNRAVEAGDILILLQRRGVLFEALLAELRRQGIPVAGADRLKLQANLAVMDVMALIQFSLLTEDDLSLASVLKSPLVPVALTDDDLTVLAPGRKGTLWQALTASGRHGETVAFLESCLAHAATASPHGFITHVLTGARQRIVARLGFEAQDATDMLLDTALSFERDSGTSLAAFLHWFRARDEDVKRELEGPAGEVRIMTVHGAKGLEANIVILPDAADMPGARGGPNLLAVPLPGNAAGFIPFFDMTTVIKPAAVSQWKDVEGDKNKDERKRLLYVAMTRARDELYIGGAQGQNKLDDDCWYSLVKAGLDNKPEEPERRGVAGLHPAGDLVRIGDEPVVAEGGADRSSGVRLPLPAWALAPAPADSRQPVWESVTRVAARGGTVFDRTAAQRGVALHRVLDQMKSGDSPAAVAARLARQSLDAALAEPLHGLLSRADTAGYFASDARSEAAIAGRLEGLPPVQGRLDRLRIDDDALWLLDFKTGRPGDMQRESHIRQMAQYAAVLAAAFPGRPVKAALLWTQDMRLETLAESALAQALAELRQEHAGGAA
ncbi:MAG: double-strand break repair helicase AddA [Rhizobiales bacterium]|nr:double-strand break repair helicase AddA [Hyphomicrobiales bacterium]